MRKHHLPLLILLLLAIVFALGIIELFKLRFESGDVYPSYSTLRTDPLGASAFYESLEKVPGISVNRDFRPTGQMPDAQGTAYLQLAGQPGDWNRLPEDSFKEIESFVRMGGRLVVALSPAPARFNSSPMTTNNTGKDKINKPDEPGKDQPKPDPKSPKPAKPKNQNDDEEGQALHLISIAEHWGVGFQVKNLKKGDDGVYEPITVDNHGEPVLPESLPWHSGAVMTNLDRAWRVIYARGPDPVLAERRLGSGTVVFLTDAYLLSNEAMQGDRHADLLAWIVGPCRSVVFDEAHFGILDQPGIAGLVRKYRLHGLVAGLLLLAGLFIWKNSTGFGPVREEETAEDFVAGKDSAAGFINLLRHHVKPQDVLNTCVAEWKKSLPPGSSSAARTVRVEALLQKENALPPRDRNPVRTYQEICAVLKKGASMKVPNPDPQVNSPKI